MKKNSFIKNVLTLMLSQGIIKSVAIVLKLYLTNKTGYKDTGNALFFAAFQIYTVFLTICSIGVPNAISSIISEKFAVGESQSAYRVLKVSIAIFGFVGFVASVVLYLLSNTIAYCYLQIPETALILKLLAPSIFIVAITSVLKGYFNGKQKMNITANALSIEQIIKTISAIAFIEVLANIVSNNTTIMACIVGITTTFGNLVSLIYILIKFSKSKQEMWTDILTSTKIKQERKKTIIKNIFMVSFPIAFCALIGTLNKTIDAITIVRITKQYLGEAEAVRQFGILSGKIESIIVFPLSFNLAFTTVLIPYVSAKNAKGDKEYSKKVLKHTMLGGIAFGIPCFLVLYLFPKEILKILFPKAFDGYLMLKYSSITIIMTILIQTINSYLQGIKNMKILIISITISSIVKLILNIILLQDKRIGIYGAIIANIISCIFILFILVYYLVKKERIIFETKNFLIKPLVLTISMYYLIQFIYKINDIQEEKVKLISTFLLFGFLYVISAYYFRIISREEIVLAISGKHKTPKWLKTNKKIKNYNKKEGF